MSIKWSTLKTAEDLELEKKEQVANSVRAERDKLISETDYFMLQDAPLAPEGVETYRQALRDITLQKGFPFDVQWPEKPA